MILFIYFVIAILVALLIGLILYARWNYGVLESLNIPVVKRSFLLGSTKDLHLRIQHFEDIARFKKYGSVYGVYEGRSPQVHICDPEIAKLILVKDYEHFRNRRDIDLGDPVLNELPDFLRGMFSLLGQYDAYDAFYHYHSQDEKSKTIRGAQTPFFAASKIKSMRFALKECIDDFCQILEEDCKAGSAKVNIASKFDGCVIDVFCRIGFGVKMGNSFENNMFVKMFKDLMGQNDDFGMMYTLSMVFPFLTKFAPTLNPDQTLKISAVLRQIMESREKSGQRQNDFIDVLNEMHAKLPSAEYKKLGISENTIFAQGIGVVLAGYDAMTTTLSMLAYYLCKYPEVQDKLFEEIDNLAGDHDGEIPFENMGELNYLQACLTEVYRLCPPFIRPERICTKDWEHKGMKIKKGMVVMIPAWAVHRNPEYFPDAETFDPERFMPSDNNNENKKQQDPYAFLTFGQGPRACIGKKFSYEVSKYILCNILLKFRFEAMDETTVKFKPGVLFLVMYDPIFINIIKR